jgi:hypothetical protein
MLDVLLRNGIHRNESKGDRLLVKVGVCRTVCDMDRLAETKCKRACAKSFAWDYAWAMRQQASDCAHLCAQLDALAYDDQQKNILKRNPSSSDGPDGCLLPDQRSSKKLRT